MELTAEQLRKMMPGCTRSRAQQMIGPLNKAMTRASINTPLRVAMFLAQVGHESMDLVFMKEIASGAAYEGRRDLGNTQPGDGRRFRGRGPIQVTGRDNYASFAAWAKIDCVNHPEMLEDPEIGFLASAWYWMSRGLNTLADKGDFLKVSTGINGANKYGFPNGWLDRQSRFATARREYA